MSALSNGGRSRSLATSSASTRPRAADSGTDSGGRGVACRSTIVRASDTASMDAEPLLTPRRADCSSPRPGDARRDAVPPRLFPECLTFDAWTVPLYVYHRAPDSYRGAAVYRTGVVWVVILSAAGLQARAADPEPVTLRGHKDPVVALAFSPDGRTLASAELKRGHYVLLWDVEAGTQRRVLSWSSIRLTALAFTPDGKTLATVDFCGNTKLWGTSSGEIEGDTFGFSTTIAMAFTPGGNSLAFGDQKGRVRLVDFRLRREEARYEK